MTNSTTKIFLAAILVAGTITTLFPSFMVGIAQASSYPDMDREKKEDKKSVSVSSLKCNNINVNVNGLSLDVFPPFLGGGVLAAEAVEPNTDANSFAAGNNGDGSQINDFRFICINNNNNTVIEAEEPPVTPVEECAEAEDIEACFEEFLEGQFSAFVEALESGIIVEINGQERTLTSFEDICEALDGLTDAQFRSTLAEIVNTAIAPPGVIILLPIEFINCIAEVLDIPIFPPPP